MDSTIDQLDRTRRRMLLGFLIAFVTWQAPTIVQDAFGAALPEAARGSLALFALACALAWIYYALRLAALQRRVAADPEAAAALDDERIRHLRARAFTFAFWATIVYLVAVRLAAFVGSVPAGPAAQGGLLVAAAAAIGAFLYLDRD